MMDSYQEILQDTFFIKYLLDIKREVRNIEAKNYLIEFIKDTIIMATWSSTKRRIILRRTTNTIPSATVLYV